MSKTRSDIGARQGKAIPERAARVSEESDVLASKLTARSQTTLPSGVRKALGLRTGDRISYVIDNDQVVMRKLQEDEPDPALAGFLDLLERDIQNHKERIVFATRGFAQHLEELTAGIEVDHDAPIEGDYEL